MVLLYGNPDPMAAFRVALIMKWMGVKDIRVLNGGYNSWCLKKLGGEIGIAKLLKTNSSNSLKTIGHWKKDIARKRIFMMALIQTKEKQSTVTKIF